MAATTQLKSNARVLVVDDEQDLMLAVVAALELDDYEVAGFGSSNGLVAVKIIGCGNDDGVELGAVVHPAVIRK